MPDPIDRLLLFDIDGTLMITCGMTSRCIERTGRALFDPGFKLGGITPGRLDHQLFADIAASNGITLTDAALERWKSAYFESLKAELAGRPEDIVVLPGVRELWRRVHDEPWLAVGLLTGNFREASQLKLDAAGIETARLHVQAHGGDAEDRVALVRFAIDQLQRRGLALGPERVTIIGDTPRDIACARGAGCRSLAVATGRYTRDQLAEHAPDALLDDLSDTDRVIDTLLTD